MISILIFSSPIISQKTINIELLNYISQYKEEAQPNIESIYNYISQKSLDPKLQAELFFYWLNQNLSYDVEGFQDGSYLTNINNPLKTKKGLCGDYANLFKKLCDKANISCFVVNGYAKSFDYLTGTNLEINHTWNIILIDEEYTVIDATWGSGYLYTLDNKLTYCKEIDMDYFMVTPQQLLKTHLSGNPLWQLSNTIIDYDKFINSDYSSINYKDYNFYESFERYKNSAPWRQRIIEHIETFHFNGDENNRRFLVSSFVEVAYTLSNSPFNPNEIRKAIEYLLQAHQLVLESTDKSLPQDYIHNIEGGIKYCEYRLAEKR